MRYISKCSEIQLEMQIPTKNDCLGYFEKKRFQIIDNIIIEIVFNFCQIIHAVSALKIFKKIYIFTHIFSSTVKIS